MASSISRFNSIVPWQAIRLLAVGAMAWLLAAVYTVNLNPEIAFFYQAHMIKESWAEKIDKEHKTKIVIYGGSSCLASIICERMLQKNGLPALNQGFGAGMGAKILTAQALKKLHPGDTLIVSLEPKLLCVPLAYEPLGVQFVFATGQLDLISGSGVTSWPGFLVDLRPGGHHVFTLLGKIALRQPLYRYSPAELDASGWHQVAEKRDFYAPSEPAWRVSEDGQRLLREVRDFCAVNNVRVAYSLPWEYCPPGKQATYQQGYRLFLADIAKFIDVLKEPAMGTHSVKEHFMDTSLHLDEVGSGLRTDELAASIRKWEVWSQAELK